MTKKETEKKHTYCKDEKCECCNYKCKKVNYGGHGGAIYGLGLIGAVVYFFQHIGSVTFGNVVMAIIKSIAWPALIVFKVLELLKF